jgi:hypothetical protein
MGLQFLHHTLGQVLKCVRESSQDLYQDKLAMHRVLSWVDATAPIPNILEPKIRREAAININLQVITARLSKPSLFLLVFSRSRITLHPRLASVRVLFGFSYVQRILSSKSNTNLISRT